MQKVFVLQTTCSSEGLEKTRQLQQHAVLTLNLFTPIKEEWTFLTEIYLKF